jgi:dihydrodiol dehydrogenase / D-xylose 1-dehydrogenase (NADP)
MRLRWGICGAGRICQDFVNAIRLLPEGEHEVTAVAASKSERAESFASAHEIPHAYGSYEEFMKSSNFDIVYIGVVNGFHKQMALLALNNGKHVLCEKPIGVNASEVEEMVNLAKEKKLFLMEAYWSRFFPVYKLIRTELDKGSIGQPKLVTATFGFPLNPDVLSKELASGTLLGIGCYCTMLSMFVFREKPEKISATGFFNKYETDDTASVTFTYGGDRMFQFIQSASLPLENKAIIIGTHGQITLPSFFWCPTEVVTQSGLQTFPLPSHSDDIKFNYPHSEGLSYEAQAVRECIAAGKTECPLMPLNESIILAEINDAIRKQLGVRYEQDEEAI